MSFSFYPGDDDDHFVCDGYIFTIQWASETTLHTSNFQGYLRYLYASKVLQPEHETGISVFITLCPHSFESAFLLYSEGARESGQLSRLETVWSFAYYVMLARTSLYVETYYLSSYSSCSRQAIYPISCILDAEARGAEATQGETGSAKSVQSISRLFATRCVNSTPRWWV